MPSSRSLSHFSIAIGSGSGFDSSLDNGTTIHTTENNRTSYHYYKEHFKLFRFLILLQTFLYLL